MTDAEIKAALLPAALDALEETRRKLDRAIEWNQKRWDRLHAELRAIGDEDLRTRCCAIVANGKATWDERNVHDDLAATKAVLAELIAERDAARREARDAELALGSAIRAAVADVEARREAERRIAWDNRVHESDTLRAALAEAIDLAEEGWAYAPAYFRDKWGYAQRIGALKRKHAP